MDQAAADAGGKGYDFRPMLAGAAPPYRVRIWPSVIWRRCTGRAVGPTPATLLQIAAGGGEGLGATGFDSCSTASNHTLDDGAEGIRRTLDALDEAGVAHAGSTRSAAEAARPTLLRAGPEEGRQGRPSRVHLRNQRHSVAGRAAVGGQHDR
ncbi:CapA family protein [Streptomyces sp. M10(2022)]